MIVNSHHNNAIQGATLAEQIYIFMILNNSDEKLLAHWGLQQSTS